jgi:hypothetical protein
MHIAWGIFMSGDNLLANEAMKAAHIVLNIQHKHKNVGKITPEAINDIKHELSFRNISATDEQIEAGWNCLFYPIHYKNQS